MNVHSNSLTSHQHKNTEACLSCNEKIIEEAIKQAVSLATYTIKNKLRI